MILKLKDGDVKIELFEDVAPNHVKRIKELANSGKYDNVVFHRVIDEKWGEVPCAFIEVVQDKPVTEKELISFCKETLAGFKVPKQVVFCELPKTSTGKIQKFELRKKF